MKINKGKKGISLIVLVITIIVMIIIAAAIILSLNSSGIIGKANQAQQEYSAAQIKEAAMVAKAELELQAADPSNTSVTGVTASNLEAKLKEKFGDNVTVTEENENYVVITNGITVTIPANKTNTDAGNEEPETFTFVITGAGAGTYTAEVGMTWAEWIFSEYNTKLVNTRYSIADGHIVVYPYADHPNGCKITAYTEAANEGDADILTHQLPTDVISQNVEIYNTSIDEDIDPSRITETITNPNT